MTCYRDSQQRHLILVLGAGNHSISSYERPRGETRLTGCSYIDFSVSRMGHPLFNCASILEILSSIALTLLAIAALIFFLSFLAEIDTSEGTKMYSATMIFQPP